MPWPLVSLTCLSRLIQQRTERPFDWPINRFQHLQKKAISAQTVRKAVTNFIPTLQVIHSGMDQLFGQANAQPRNPRQRRQTSSGLGSFFKNSLGNAFLSFFQHSIKPTLKDNEQTIKLNFKKINDIIDSVDEHIKKRMQAYQNEVFEIIKDEISDMKVETEKLVEQLNKKIAEKNIHSQLWHIKNQLDYFKIQALKLFQENKRYRMELKLQHKAIKDLQIDIECQDELLQKLRKKYMKEKLKSSQQMPSELKSSRDGPFLTQTFGIPQSRLQISKSLRSQKGQMQQLSVVEDKIEEQSLVDIRLSNNNPNHVGILLGYDPAQNIRESSTPSLELRDSMLSNDLKDFQPVQFVRVESFLEQSPPISMIKPKFKDAVTQTHPLPSSKLKIVKKNDPQIDQAARIDQRHQAIPEKLISFSNRFSFNKSSRHKAKAVHLQHSLRQRQTLRMRTESDKNQSMSIRYMSKAFIKNRLQDMESQGKLRNKSQVGK